MGRRAVSGGEGGYILYVALAFLILLGLVALMATDSTVSQVQSAGQEVRDKRAFFRAEGGGNLCLWELRNRLQRDLAAWFQSQNSIGVVTPYVTNVDPAGLLADHAFQGGTSYGPAFTRDNGTQARLTLSYTAAGGAGAHECNLTVLSRGNPVNQGAGFAPNYLFRYSYAIDSSAAGGRVARQVNVQGSFAVRVQQDNFARYALFTNQQQNSAGQRVWFTNRTNFSGPVHTNGEFNFALNPGANFTGLVTSAASSASFYNNGDPVGLDADRNGDIDVPNFLAGFQRGVDGIPMPGTTIADRQAEIALGRAEGSGTGSPPNGVYLGTSGGTMTGGIYIQGDATLAMSVIGNDRAEYTITRGGTTTTVRTDYTNNQTQIKVGGGGWTTYTGLPNGMIYAEGNLTSLSGTVQKDSKVTVAAKNSITITNHITYENYTPAAGDTPPSAEGTTNVLGILSWQGNVLIGTGTPNDINVHATVMTPNGEFAVQNYDTRGAQGTATLLGGVIQDKYGAFGTFSGNTIDTGYGRRFVYDTRMGEGTAPPFFPTTGRLVGAISGITDRPNWQQTR